MAKSLFLAGSVLVSDILLAFEPIIEEDLLLRLDAAVARRRDDRLSFDDVEVGGEHAVDALDDAGLLPESEAQFDQTDIIDLAEAIRCGETERAELLLERVFAGLPDATTIREWIDRGRFSKKAREAKAANARLPRGHTAAEMMDRRKVA